MQKGARSIGISIVSGRRAVLTRPHNGHSQCHYCGQCGRGCDVGAFFNSTDYLIEPALKTDRGRANGVQYFDRNSKEERKINGRIVVVAASCIDSTRILLNSKSAAYPNGTGNSSDVIGRYLSEQTRFHMFAFVPELIGGPTLNDDGIGGEHIYMPRFNHRDGRKREYLLGFGMQFWGLRLSNRRKLREAAAGLWGGVQEERQAASSGAGGTASLW